MKILCVGYHNPKWLGLTEYIEYGIESLHHECRPFDYRDWLIPGRIRDKVKSLHQWDLKRINKKLKRVVHEYRPDVVLISGGWTIFPNTIREIRNTYKLRVVQWIADFPLMFEKYLKTGPECDVFFASGTDALSLYQDAGNKNGYWLPFACDPRVHKPVGINEKDYEDYACDICFVGSYYSERVEILEAIADYDLRIWGPGWGKLPETSPLRKCVKGSGVTPQQWVKIFSASKIVLNIIGHRCDVMEPYIEAEFFKMTNTKLFEALGCGAFQMVDNRADAVTLFQDKEHVVFYSHGKELREKVRKYLEEPNERRRIAQAGRKEVLEKHTYKKRIQKMVSYLDFA